SACAPTSDPALDRRRPDTYNPVSREPLPHGSESRGTRLAAKRGVGVTTSEAMRAALRPRLERALDFAAGQAQRVLDLRPGYLPMYTVEGRWGREGERWTHWCE